MFRIDRTLKLWQIKKLSILGLPACVLFGWGIVDITALAQDLPPVTAVVKKVHPKLPSVLQELFGEFSQDPARGRAFLHERLHPKQFVGDSVRLILWPQGMRPANIPKGILQALGATVEAESPSLLQVLVPIPKLILVADQLPGVQFIGLPSLPDPSDVPIQAQAISEGVTKTGANSYHSNGITGSGVRVAIIDLGFQNIQAAISNGEFGSPHKIDPSCTKNYITNTTGIAAVDTGGTDHGVSVAHVVHSMAPGASLCLKLIGTLTHLENAKNDAKAEGVRVINHSVGWVNLDSYYDGTGTIDAFVNDAFNNNILWTNAAGNYADGPHWQGGFFNPDGDVWLNFTTDDECNNVSLSAGQTFIIFMNWDDYPASSQDYDLFLNRVNPNGTLTQVASSEGFQNGTQQPAEEIFYSASTTATYCWSIKNFSGPATAEIEVFSFTHDFEHFVASSSLPDPANGLNVMAVAAIRHTNWITGPQELFSSQGPTNNSKFATARVEPAISGPDGTLDYNGTSPLGTSFSSPHVAGCAALIKAANPAFTAAQMRNKLESEAIDMGAAGKDNVFGWGRINCTLALDTEAGFRVERATGSVYADGQYFCGLPSNCYLVGNADIAERIDVSEPVEPGDVVELDPDHPGSYRKARSPNSRLIAGVIASAPGFMLANRREELAFENPSEGRVQGLLSRLVLPPWDDMQVSLRWTLRPLLERSPERAQGVSIAQLLLEIAQAPRSLGRPSLALVGQVFVKATTENGPIQPGDLLVSASTPGYVMRCASPQRCEGAIVGKSMDSLERGSGLIRIWVAR